MKLAPGTHRLIALAATIALYACSQPTPPETRPAADSADESKAVSVLLFGDTGYDYGWLDEEDYEDAFTGREFVINELDDWIGDNLPIEEFDLPPMHFAEQTGGYVMASGMWPVSNAARQWCAPEDRCDFAVMLGDNIYDAGATLGADGRDDKARFEALLDRPYRGLQQQDPRFVIYPVLGNHDWGTSREGALAQVEWLEQSPLYRMDGIFYRARPAPDVELFAIDTTVLLASETVPEDSVSPAGVPTATAEEEDDKPWASPVGPEMRMVEWLERALADSDARWKIVIGHHPLWSSSGTKHEEAKVLRRLLLPALCRYADAYIAGHDHTLEVHADDCSTEGGGYAGVPPLLSIVSGAAGKQRPVHTPFMAWQDREYPQLQTYFVEGLVWGFAELVLDRDASTVRVITTPDSGSGDPMPAFEHEFERRSGAAGNAAEAP